MTVRSRAALKALFEDGDVPNSAAYSDFIDSGVNLIDTTAQAIASDLKVPKLITTTLSAIQLYTRDLNANSLSTIGTVDVDAGSGIGEIITSSLRHRSPFGAFRLNTANNSYGGSLVAIKVSAPTTAYAVDLLGFTHTSPNRLTYAAGSDTIRALVSYNISAYLSIGTIVNVHTFVAKNSVVLRNSRQGLSISSAFERTACGHIITTLSAGSFLEIWTETTATAAAITVRNLSMTVHPVSWSFVIP
ncbi:MAG: hypothetical protein ACREXR_00395 [Gammaproteobacteria bacterium]